MTIKSSGPLSLTEIVAEFGGSAPHSLSEYYAGGANVPSGAEGDNGAIPSSGAISFYQFYGASASTVVGSARIMGGHAWEHGGEMNNNRDWMNDIHKYDFVTSVMSSLTATLSAKRRLETATSSSTKAYANAGDPAYGSGQGNYRVQGLVFSTDTAFDLGEIYYNRTNYSDDGFYANGVTGQTSTIATTICPTQMAIKATPGSELSIVQTFSTETYALGTNVTNATDDGSGTDKYITSPAGVQDSTTLYSLGGYKRGNVTSPPNCISRIFRYNIDGASSDVAETSTLSVGAYTSLSGSSSSDGFFLFGSTEGAFQPTGLLTTIRPQGPANAPPRYEAYKIEKMNFSTKTVSTAVAASTEENTRAPAGYNSATKVYHTGGWTVDGNNRGQYRGKTHVFEFGTNTESIEDTSAIYRSWAYFGVASCTDNLPLAQ